MGGRFNRGAWSTRVVAVVLLGLLLFGGVWLVGVALAKPKPPLPSVQFTVTPSDPSSSAVSTFDWVGSDPVSGGGIAYYLCSIENGKFVRCPAGAPPYTFTVGSSNNGEHQFAVEAVDHAGNVSDPAKYKWKLQQLASPSVSTRLSAATVAVGTGVHDSASLSRQTGGGKHGDGDRDGDGDDRFAPGHAPAAGGTVSYTVYPSLAACLNQSGGTAEGTVTVSNGNVPDSQTFTPSSPGVWYWQAVYSGDANNNPASSSCSSEKLTVTKASPSVVTVASGPVTVGGSISDTATLVGAFGTPAAGTVTFKVYAASATRQRQRPRTWPRPRRRGPRQRRARRRWVWAAACDRWWHAGRAGRDLRVGVVHAAGRGQLLVGRVVRGRRAAMTRPRAAAAPRVRRRSSTGRRRRSRRRRRRVSRSAGSSPIRRR